MSIELNGTTGIDFNDGSNQSTAATPYGRKNLIINGDMRIDQRNAGSSVTPTNGSYSLDRWGAFATAASKFTVQQNAGSVTPPAGFQNYLGVTSTSAYSVGAGDVFSIFQCIEGLNAVDLNWGTASASSVTVSFWVRSSLTGTFGGSIINSAENRSYPFTYTISSANTWEQKTVTIAGDTTGTWLTTNGIGLRVLFNLGTGTTFSGTAGAWAGSTFYSATGATSVVGTSGATFYITGIQLEVGDAASDFEFMPYDMELARCMRYYEKAGWKQGDKPSATAGYAGALAAATLGNNTNATPGFRWTVIKRAQPTVTVYGSILDATETAGVVADWNFGTSCGTATVFRVEDCGYNYVTAPTATSYGHIYRIVADAEL